MKYWEKKGKFGGSGYEEVDWEVFHKAIKASPLSRRIFIIKHWANRCGVNVSLHRRGARSDPLCARCKEQPETAVHVMQCQDPAAQLGWETVMLKVSSCLEDLGTPVEVAQGIVDNLRKWQKGESHGVPMDLREFDKQAFAAQEKLGWTAFVEGRIAIEWEQARTGWIRQPQQRVSRRWATAMVQKMWDVSWDMWNQRNETIHAMEEAAELVRVEDDIRQEFDYGWTGLDPEFQSLFSVGIKAVMQRTKEQKVTWLRKVKTHREYLEKFTDIQKQRRTLHTFFNHNKRNKDK